MIYGFFFLAELIILFLLSRTLTRVISQTIYHYTHSEKAAISVIAFLFFPGTLIHELAHAITAGILGVPVGHMEFLPKIQGEKVKLGSVQIGQTDPIRRFFIGVAPFIVGTGLILGLLYLTVQHQLFDTLIYSVLIGYAVFEISNTMFSSSKDMEGAVEFLIGFAVICIIFFGLGFRIPALNPATVFENPFVTEIFKQGSLYLLLPLVIDSVVILLFHHRKRHNF